MAEDGSDTIYGPQVVVCGEQCKISKLPPVQEF